MKKFLLSITALAFMLCASAQDSEIVTKIKKIPEVTDVQVYNAQTDSEYVAFNFTQQLGKKFKTEEKNTTTFSTRVLAVIRDVNQPTLFYVSGYQLGPKVKELEKHIDRYKMYSNYDIIGVYPNSNLIAMEHRFFGPEEKDPNTQFYITTPGKSSYPNDFTNNLDYLTTENAATDFHNIIDAMKNNIVQGKTAMAGWSKGGMTTAFQSLYYPKDVDVFIPYAAPFCNSLKDPRLYDYMTDSISAGSSELRKSVNACINEMMKKDTTTNYVYSEYHRLKTKYYRNDPYYKNYTTEQIDSVVQWDYEQFLYGRILWNLWAHNDRKTISTLLDINAIKTSNNASELLLYSLWTGEVQSQVKPGWKDEIDKTPRARFRRNIPISPEQWYKLDPSGSTAYDYQAFHELGTYYIPFKENFPGCISATADFTEEWQKDILKEWGKDYTHATYDKLFKSVKETDSKILFIYGGDDPWTGARIEDQYIAKDNVKRYILPSQNHGVLICSAAKDIMQSIYNDVIFPWLGDPDDPTSINMVNVNANANAKANANGCYDLLGRKVGADYKGIVIRNGRKVLVK